jgi:RHS repeat-associated protein
MNLGKRNKSNFLILAILRICLMATVVLCLSPAAWAQTYGYTPSMPDNALTPADAIGIPPHASATGDNESVSLAAGTNNLFIPALSLPQRNGWSMTLGYVHSSASMTLNQRTTVQVQSVTSSGMPIWIDNYTYNDSMLPSTPSSLPLQINLPRLEASLEYVGDITMYSSSSQVPVAQAAVFCMTNFRFSDWGGNTHPFGAVTACSPTSLGNGNNVLPPMVESTLLNPGGPIWSSDGSWLRIDTSNSSDVRVSTKDGTVYHFLGFLSSRGGRRQVFSSMVDTSGNTVSAQTSIDNAGQSVYTVTDQVGRTVTINSAGISYTDSNGKPQTISLTVTPQPAQAYTFNSNCWFSGSPYKPPAHNPVVHTASNNVNLIPVNIDLVFPAVDSTGTGRAYHMQFDVLGRISKIQYPARGYTRYDYQNLSSEVNIGQVSCKRDFWQINHAYACADSGGSCSSSQELVTTYTPTPANGMYNSSIDVTGPTGVKVHHVFINDGGVGPDSSPSPRESDTLTYDASGNLLRTEHIDYTPYVQALDLQAPAKITATLNDVSPTLNSIVTYQYDSIASVSFGNSYQDPQSRIPVSGNVTEFDEQDFDGTVKRTTTNAWMKGGIYDISGNNILDRLQSKTVTDPATGVQSVVSYGYDAVGYVISKSVSGTGVSALTSNYLRNSFGQITQATDPNGNVTKFDYTDNWKDSSCAPASNSSAYLTKVTDALQHVSQIQYYSCTGLKAVVQDPNDLAANNSGIVTTYDALERPLTVTAPDGGGTTYSYSDAVPVSAIQTTTITQKTTTTPALSHVQKTVLDGFSRTIQTQLTSDPAGTDFADTTYDVLGRVATVSNPYRSTSDPTYGLTTNQYDALGRVTQVTKQDGSISTVSYSANCTTATDEAGKQRKACSDALGRLTNVWEDPSGLNYETDYQYDALGNLLRVDQKGSPPATNVPIDSSNWRTRLFTYDSLGRLLTAYNPESGTISYAYDADGNVKTKTAPAPNQTGSATVTTTFAYDALNRLTSKTYSDSTPSAYQSYDAGGGWGVPQTNVIGRLAEVWIGSPCCATNGTIFGYDVMGRVVMSNQSTPGVSNLAVNYTHDLAGNVTSYTTGVGVTFTQAFDSAGRITKLTSNMVGTQWPAALATVDPSIGYYATGAMRKLTLGNGLTETAAFNVRLQPCRTNVNSSGSALLNCADAVPAGNVQDLSYGFNLGTSDNGNVLSMSAVGSQSFNRTYSYDALNRLQSLSGPGDTCTGLSWTYDAWGNRTDQSVTGGSCNSFHQPTNTTNRLSGTGYQYDAAGNLINDGSHSYTYDAENRIIQVDGGNTASYVYDAMGHRVRKMVGSSWTDYVYGLSGNVVTEYTSPQGTCAPICWATSFIYLGGSLVAEYKDGTTYFVHKDHLGSTRLLSKMDQTPKDLMDYLPFGEQIAGNTGTTHKFTGKERDSETGLDYFGARYYGSALGRFSSSDPKPSSAHPADPQSWNRYSYTDNNPLGFVDPDGQEKLKVELTIYIPGNKITDPLGRTYNANGNGDGRDPLKYKGYQVVHIETDANKSPNPQLSTSRAVGVTIRYDSQGREIKRAKADDKGLDQHAERNKDGSTNVNFNGSITNPLGVPVVTPAIDFNINVTCSGSSCQASSGQHDGFPAYRIEVTDEENGNKSEIYFYDPYKAGKGPMSLFPPMDCKVPSGSSCDKGITTPAKQGK